MPQDRISTTPPSQESSFIPVTKHQGTLRPCIDFHEFPNLHATIELLDDTQPLEQRLVQLELVVENRHQSLQHNEAHKKRVKASFNCHITPCSFVEGDLVLRYDIAKEALGPGNFETLSKWPYIIKHCLRQGAYILTEPDRTYLTNPFNGLYLKNLYP